MSKVLTQSDVTSLAVQLLGNTELAEMSLQNIKHYWDEVSCFDIHQWTRFIVRSSVVKLPSLGSPMSDKTAKHDLELAASILEGSLPLSPDHVLKEVERNQVNAALVAQGFDGSKNFRSVRWAMTEIEQALDPLNLIVAGVKSAYAFSMDEGNAVVLMARKAGEMESGTDISNSSIQVKWHALQADAISVTAHAI